jgi:hypothetical protein
VAEAGAAAHNGGLCLRAMDGIAFESTLFARCSHRSAAPEAACVLLVYDNPHDSAVVSCLFVDNRMDETCTIAVIGGRGLLISECLFSGTRGKEIKDQNVVVEESCKFESRAFPEIQITSFASGNIPGFDKARTIAVRSAKPQNMLKSPVLRHFGKNRRITMVIASCAIAAVLVTVAMVLRGMWRWMCRGMTKVPRAFQ